jgi:hypothetical protein
MKLLIITLVATLLLQIAFPPGISAGEINPGARVRVKAPSFTHDDVIGTLESVDSDTLRIVRRGRRMSIPIAALTKIEVSTRRKRRVGRSAVIGMLCGFTAGLVGGYYAGDDDPNQFLSATKEEKATAFGLGGGVLGLAVGVLVGVTKKADIWENIPLARLRVSIQNSGRRISALTASFSF